jgi:hypothetical protein
LFFVDDNNTTILLFAPILDCDMDTKMVDFPCPSTFIKLSILNPFYRFSSVEVNFWMEF